MVDPVDKGIGIRIDEPATDAFADVPADSPWLIFVS
jgi:hypothetical protein